MNIKLSLALAAVFLPALCLGAGTPEATIVGKAPAPSVVVRFGDLDLSTAQGAKAFKARLNDAAWQVCEQVLVQPVGIDGAKCRAALVDDAEQRVATR